jgi:LacI family transcriptional regulator
LGKRKVTSFDVAKRAGVSRSTVSLVLNRVEKPVISEETKQRVFRAAKDLGYVPHAAGKALASQRTKNIGLVFSRSQASHTFLLQVIEGLVQFTRDNDLRLLLDTFEDSGQESILELTRAKHIDGLVMFEPRTGDPTLHLLAEDAFPIVLIGSLPAEKLSSIDIDNRRAAARVVEHLVETGARRIACITNAAPSYTASASRLRGYKDALKAAGLPWDECLVRHGNFTSESGYLAMRDLLERHFPGMDGVFVASDTVAFGALRAMHEGSVKVPDDVLVAGFDDIPLARYASPPLTTMQFSGVEEGKRAGEMLNGLIEGRVKPGRRVKAEARLVVRESTLRNGRS